MSAFHDSQIPNLAAGNPAAASNEGIHEAGAQKRSSGFIERLLTLGSRIHIRIFSLLLSGQFAEFGSGSRVAPPFRFAGLNRISLGESVLINRDCWILVTEDCVGPDPVKLRIGSHSAIGMGATIAAAQQIVIGEHVVMARNVYIADHGHAFLDVNRPIMDQGIDNIKPVFIGKHSWVGQNAVVLPGSLIGEHCVIGANSVVNRSIPDRCIAVGAPARVVKRYNEKTRKWEKCQDFGSRVTT